MAKIKRSATNDLDRPDLDQTFLVAYSLFMSEVVSISEAKAQLSKLVKRAQAGETIYVGAYGNAQAVIGPVPVHKPIPVGVWAHKRKPNAYEDDDLISPDPDVIEAFSQSISDSSDDSHNP